MKTIKIFILFPAVTIKQPTMSDLVKKCNVEVNILHADISLNKEGKLIADLTGTEEEIEKAYRYIEEAGLSYYVFEKKIIWQEGSCVHCGACTAVCPSSALYFDKDWSLKFDSEKCLVCGLCVKTCPLGVMNVTGEVEI